MLKSNPHQYAEYKRKDEVKQREYRRSMNEEKRKQYNEKARLRMQKYRQKSKREKRLTRNDKLKLKASWREAKSRQRARMSSNEKKQVNARRREKYKIMKAKKRLNFSAEAKSPLKPKEENILRSLKVTTPCTRQKLKDRGLIFTPESMKRAETDERIALNVKKSLKQFSQDKSKKGRMTYRWFLRAVVVEKACKNLRMKRRLDVQYHFWRWATTYLPEEDEKRSDAMSHGEKEDIQKFYMDASEELPCKKTILKGEIRKSVLNKTISELHADFQSKTNKKISLSTFQKLRPKQCLTVNMNKFSYCLCEYCINVEFNLRSLRNIATFKGCKLQINTKYQVADNSICPREHMKLSCLERKCKQCGTEHLREEYQKHLNRVLDEPITWQRWQNSTVNSLQEKRKVLLDIQGTVQDCIDDLCKQAQTLALHLFTAKWQRDQVSKLKANPPKDWLISIVDFSENYRCTSQDEIAAAYYNYTQVTLLPMVTFYKCHDCKSSTVEESIVFITPDLVHDSHVVNKAVSMMLQHLEKERNFIPKHHVQASDGCLSQFKSKNPFFFLSQSDGMERIYFGSRHGKSVCDGLGGTIKTKVTKYVKSRAGKIRNAREFYEYCKQSQVICTDGEKCQHKKRVFLFADKVERIELGELTGIVGTQKIHQIRAISPGVVQARQFACFCIGCLNGVTKCENQNRIRTEWWKPHILEKSKRKEGQKDKTPKRKKPEVKAKKSDKTSKRKKTEVKAKKSCNKLAKKKNQKSNTKTETRLSVEHLRSLLAFKGSQYRLKAEIEKVMNIVEPLPVDVTHTVVNLGKSIDRCSMDLLPKDINSDLFPVQIVADGNCLARCASLLGYGTEDKYLHMKVRLANEMISNKEWYLTKYCHFGMYSDKFTGGMTLKSDQDLDILFEKEVETALKDGAYSGMWHLAAYATVLQRKIQSVYPQYGGYTVRKEFHIMLEPRTGDAQTSLPNHPPLFIMWSNLSGKDKPEKFWHPNHFVPLLPLHGTVRIEDVEVVTEEELQNDLFQTEAGFYDVIQDIVSRFSNDSSCLDESDVMLKDQIFLSDMPEAENATKCMVEEDHSSPSDSSDGEMAAPDVVAEDIVFPSDMTENPITDFVDNEVQREDK